MSLNIPKLKKAVKTEKYSRNEKAEADEVP
jgi:hypothetical protein